MKKKYLQLHEQILDYFENNRPYDPQLESYKILYLREKHFCSERGLTIESIFQTSKLKEISQQEHWRRIDNKSYFDCSQEEKREKDRIMIVTGIILDNIDLSTEKLLKLTNSALKKSGFDYPDDTFNNIKSYYLMTKVLGFETVRRYVDGSKKTYFTPALQ